MRRLAFTGSLLAVILVATSTRLRAVVTTVDADSFANGAVLDDAFAGVTLSAVGSGTDDGSVYAKSDALASTGDKLFGFKLGSISGQWIPEPSDGRPGQYLRADFGVPTDYVAIDFIGNDPSGSSPPTDLGALWAYDATGALLETAPSAGLLRGQSQTVVISHSTADIAYVMASGYYVDPVNHKAADNVNLDHLVFNVPPSGEPTALLFREHGSGIPGLDHVGFYPGNEQKVWESTIVPSSNAGDYYDPNTHGTVTLVAEYGVQQQHTYGSFSHAAKQGSTSSVTDFRVAHVDAALAADMVTAIESQENAGYNRHWEMGLWPLSPDIQKGRFGTFSCVGLTEWAAEQSPHSLYQGFIPDAMETFPVHGTSVSTLTPQFQFWAATGRTQFFNSLLWVQGLADPVDFILTNPAGQRFGYTEALGLIEEIPGCFYSGDGDAEQLVITTAMPGLYTVELFGLDAEARAAFGGPTEGVEYSGYLARGESVVLQFRVGAVPEPATMLVFAVGVLALRRRSRHC